MVTAAYALGFIVFLIMTGVFAVTLNGVFSSGYHLAAHMSVLVFSGFCAVLFLILSAVQGGQSLRQHGRSKAQNPTQGTPPAIFDRFTSLANVRPHLLPQSEFARRWAQRQSMTYEDSVCESCTAGEPRPYRLKCRQLDLFKSQLIWAIWPRTRRSPMRNFRRG